MVSKMTIGAGSAVYLDILSLFLTCICYGAAYWYFLTGSIHTVLPPGEAVLTIQAGSRVHCCLNV